MIKFRPIKNYEFETKRVVCIKFIRSDEKSQNGSSISVFKPNEYMNNNIYRPDGWYWSVNTGEDVFECYRNPTENDFLNELFQQIKDEKKDFNSDLEGWKKDQFHIKSDDIDYVIRIMTRALNEYVENEQRHA